MRQDVGQADFFRQNLFESRNSKTNFNFVPTMLRPLPFWCIVRDLSSARERRTSKHLHVRLRANIDEQFFLSFLWARSVFTRLVQDRLRECEELRFGGQQKMTK